MAIINEIPTIDVSPYLDPNSTTEAKRKVVEAVQFACEHFGFLQVKGHGVPIQTQREMLQSCKTLFDLPDEQKEALSLKNNPARRGYEKIGEQVLDSKSLPDYKEICPPVNSYQSDANKQQGFYMGREVPADQAGFLRGPNQWPTLPEQAFHAPVTEYYNHMLRLSNSMLEILVIALGHNSSVLENFTKEPVVNLKLLHYPPHKSTDSRQFGAAAHTDFGAMTILLQAPGKDGLQVYYAPTDEWLCVPALEDVFVINMGDLVQKWTDGKYSSTLHRVINAADGDRYSVPCFYQGNLAATNPFRPEDKSGETVEAHIRRKFDQSYGLKN